ncbi:MAG: Fe-S cluster assembly ATP-binding protein [Candidatus Poriferisodalaceae bacterium]|jgi:Fe-S cluster assembly ATP-binding protein
MPNTPLFEVCALEVKAADGRQILHGVDLAIGRGEVHAIMGPSGSGKSTLAAALMGSPEFAITTGSIKLEGDDITRWDPDVRAKAGMFLAFQFPQEVGGVSVSNFLCQALSACAGRDVPAVDVYMGMQEWIGRLGIDPSILDRYLGEGLSGSEKTRNEILQLAILQPKLAILDATHSGSNPDELDRETLGFVANGIRAVRVERPEMGVLVTTRDQHLLHEIEPDYIHILADGKIMQSGGSAIGTALERDGYESFCAA